MSSRSLNRVSLIGNLTRDPELRYTPQGTAVCTMTVATNRSWQPSDGGERREETEFHRIVSWQKLAELCAQLLFKGRKVFVEGRLQTRRWTDQQGNERSTTEIVIDDMIVLDNRRREDSGGRVNTQTGGASGMSAAMADDHYPEVQADSTTVTDDSPTTEQVKEVKPEKKAKTESVEKDSKKAVPAAVDEKSKKAKAGVKKADNKVNKDEEINPDDIPF